MTTVEQLKAGIRRATLAGEIVPVFCGSALKNKGVQKLLDAIVEFLPSPLDRPAIAGTGKDGEGVETREPADGEPFSALVFKILAEKHGDLSFLRVYSGTLKAGSRAWAKRSERRPVVRTASSRPAARATARQASMVAV